MLRMNRWRPRYGSEFRLRIQYRRGSSRRRFLRRALEIDLVDQVTPRVGLRVLQTRRRVGLGRLPGRFYEEWIRVLQRLGWRTRWRSGRLALYVYASTVSLIGMTLRIRLRRRVRFFPFRRKQSGSKEALVLPSSSMRRGRRMGRLLEDDETGFPIEVIQETTWISVSAFFPWISTLGSGRRWGRTRGFLSERLVRGLYLRIGRQKMNEDDAGYK